MKLLNMLGLAKKSEVDELRKQVENSLWLVMIAEENNKNDSIVVATDNVMISDVSLKNGRRILVAPNVRNVLVKNVYVE